MEHLGRQNSVVETAFSRTASVAVTSRLNLNSLEVLSYLEEHFPAERFQRTVVTKALQHRKKQTQTLNVWYIYLHLVFFYGKCR